MGSMKLLNWSTREIALVSILSAVWITSQIYLGPIVGQITGMHGMVNRLVGWFLLLVVAELTGKFGRASLMAVIASLVTRTIRRSSLEGLIVGAGYVLGGLTFDLLFFVPIRRKPKGKTRTVYLLVMAIVSGVIASVPYLLYKLYFLGLYGFIAWIPVNAFRIVKEVLLSFLGVFIGLPILPQIKFWSHGEKQN